MSNFENCRKFFGILPNFEKSDQLLYFGNVDHFEYPEKLKNVVNFIKFKILVFLTILRNCWNFKCYCRYIEISEGLQISMEKYWNFKMTGVILNESPLD